jgi:hypothetical protein
MTSTRFLAALASVFVLAASASARADGETGEAPAASPVPTTAPAAAGSTTVVAPPGSGGVTVVAPTPGGGTVTASGCSTVVVNGAPTLIGPGGAPCPANGAYPNYAPYSGTPYGGYAAPPPTMPYYDVRPRYAPDPDRKAAQIGASIGFGVGGGIAGIMYMVQYSEERDRCRSGRFVQYSDGTSSYETDDSGCNGAGARASLITYGAIVTFLPSLPRFVVGDTTKGLIYTGLRGAAFATAALVDWGDDGDTRWQGPFLLGFVAPITLGIIDLATTPHREDLVEKEKAAMRKPGINGIMPIAMTEKTGQTHGAMVSLQGRF